MHTYKMWLSVFDQPGISDLWTREVTAAFLPSVGQRVAVLTTPDEPEGSKHEDVTEVFFDFDGTANVTVRSVLLDPDEEDLAINRREMATYRHRSTWVTSRDGAMHVRLLECGWRRY